MKYVLRRLRFDLVRPCTFCPFRSDITFPLRPERVRGILEAILEEDKWFQCHKTIDYWEHESEAAPGVEEGNETEYISNGNEQFCAGALIMLHKQGNPNFLPRMAAQFGLFRPEKLDMKAPVFETPEAMIERMEQLEAR